MPVSIAQLRNSKASIPVSLEINGEAVELSVTYNPNWYDGAAEEGWRELPEGLEYKHQRVAWLLSKELVAWDLMEGAKPYPLTLEALMAVPYGVLTAIQAAINDHQSVPKGSGATSSAG